MAVSRADLPRLRAARRQPPRRSLRRSRADACRRRIPAPYQLDAARTLAYLSAERRPDSGRVPPWATASVVATATSRSAVDSRLRRLRR